MSKKYGILKLEVILLLTVKNIRKTYPEVVAVDCLSFDVKQGEIFGLLG